MIEEQIKVFEKNISKVINKYEKLLLNLTKEIDFSKLNFETKHITWRCDTHLLSVCIVLYETTGVNL